MLQKYDYLNFRKLLHTWRQMQPKEYKECNDLNKCFHSEIKKNVKTAPVIGGGWNLKLKN